eukprot:TRINITY_DN3868_c0_g1_i1.p1 TRINITY_DN3868_c0_g1~~TRINITY_DN3868_c0_g1_i1.p1  ORF type:complete len:332 (-),score=46.83 TRINITY_DN3868_c0_g1_i1:60-1055(-)
MSKMIQITGDHPQGLALVTRIWLMQSLGEQFGKVSYCKKPPTTGDPNTDVAFVAFESSDDAEKAVEALKTGITLSTTWQNVTINIKGDWKPGGGGGSNYSKGGSNGKGGRHWQDEDVETSRDLLLRKERRDDRRSRSRRRSSRSRSRGRRDDRSSGYADRDRRDYRSDRRYDSRSRHEDDREKRDDSRSRRDDRDDRRRRSDSRSRARDDDSRRRDNSRSKPPADDRDRRKDSRSRHDDRSKKRSRSHSTGRAPADDRRKDDRGKSRSQVAENLLNELKQRQTAPVMEQLEAMQREEFQSLPIEALLNFIIERSDKKTPLHEQVAKFLDSH